MTQDQLVTIKNSHLPEDNFSPKKLDLVTGEKSTDQQTKAHKEKKLRSIPELMITKMKKVKSEWSVI